MLKGFKESIVIMLRSHNRNNLEYWLDKAADAIEELSKQNEKWEEAVKTALDFIPCWVSVTERLPEKRKWVLCRCECNIVEVLRWENNEWYHDPLHVYYPSFVTHWMPLPEPPKDEAPTGPYDLLYEEGGANTT